MGWSIYISPSQQDAESEHKARLERVRARFAPGGWARFLFTLLVALGVLLLAVGAFFLYLHLAG
ncbi:MAG: hypothetical protein Q8O40_06080 [Chloroflexota bacterium]|nr:hypothetical protein [Chloroflexota bacterium]